MLASLADKKMALCHVSPFCQCLSLIQPIWWRRAHYVTANGLSLHMRLTFRAAIMTQKLQSSPICNCLNRLTAKVIKLNTWKFYLQHSTKKSFYWATNLRALWTNYGEVCSHSKYEVFHLPKVVSANARRLIHQEHYIRFGLTAHWTETGQKTVLTKKYATYYLAWGKKYKRISKIPGCGGVFFSVTLLSVVNRKDVTAPALPSVTLGWTWGFLVVKDSVGSTTSGCQVVLMGDWAVVVLMIEAVWESPVLGGEWGGIVGGTGWTVNAGRAGPTVIHRTITNKSNAWSLWSQTESLLEQQMGLQRKQ